MSNTTETTTPDVLNFADIEGSNLLRPFATVYAADQARLIGRLTTLGFNIDGEDDTDLQELDMEAVADFIDYVTDKFAVDADKFREFTAGYGGLNKALSLTLSYAAELGKEQS